MKTITSHSINPHNLNTYAPCQSNSITKEYYYTLLSQINNGATVKATVCRIENITFGTTSYYLTSVL